MTDSSRKPVSPGGFRSLSAVNAASVMLLYFILWIDPAIILVTMGFVIWLLHGELDTAAMMPLYLAVPLMAFAPWSLLFLIIPKQQRKWLEELRQSGERAEANVESAALTKRFGLTWLVVDLVFDADGQTIRTTVFDRVTAKTRTDYERFAQLHRAGSRLAVRYRADVPVQAFPETLMEPALKAR